MIAETIKKIFSINLIVIFCSFLSTFSYADKLYIGFGLSQLDYKRDNVRRGIMPDGTGTNRVCGFREDGIYDNCTNEDNGRVAQLFDADLDLDMFSIKIGYQFHRDFSFEFRGGIGTSEVSIADYAEDFEAYGGIQSEGEDIFIFITTPEPAEMKLNRSFGLYLRAGGSQESTIKYVDKILFDGLIISPYFFYGYEQVKYTTSVSKGDLEGHSNDNAQGLGLNIYPSSQLPFSINFEVKQQKNKISSNSTIDQKYISFGIDFLF